MTAQGNGRDRATALAELRQRLAVLRPKERLDALLDQKNARAVVRALPAEEVFQLILDVGLADSTEIVQLASPRQFQAFVDLGAWERDRIDPHGILTWIRAARGDDPESFLKKVNGMDLELLEFLLRSFVVVHDLEEDPDVNPQNVTMESPEGKYLLEFNAEGPELAALRSLMNDLYSQGPLETARMIEALRWELMSELEETALQFRNARLEDMGFPPGEAAAAVFSYIEPDKIPKATTAGRLRTEQLATSSTETDYVTAMLNGFSGVERENLETELRSLMNSVLVVEGASPGDANALRDMAGLTRDTLSLGLEHLTSANPTLAPEVVETHPLKTVFQVGFSLTLKLKHHADRLVREPGVREGNTFLFLRDELGLVGALRLKRPRRWLRVEGADPVPFRNRRELQDAAAGLARAAQQVLIFRALMGTSREAVTAALAPFGGTLEKVGTDRLFAAVVAHAVLDGELRLEPVSESRLVELAERLFEGDVSQPRLRKSARERAIKSILTKTPPPATDEVGRMVERILTRFGDEWGAAFAKDARLDPILASLHLPLSTPGLP